MLGMSLLYFDITTQSLPFDDVTKETETHKFQPQTMTTDNDHRQ